MTGSIMKKYTVYFIPVIILAADLGYSLALLF